LESVDEVFRGLLKVRKNSWVVSLPKLSRELRLPDCLLYLACPPRYHTYIQPTYVVIRQQETLPLPGEWANNQVYGWAITSLERVPAPLVPTLGSTVTCNSKRDAALVRVVCPRAVRKRMWRIASLAETSPSSNSWLPGG
jgi:hypothetical protein